MKKLIIASILIFTSSSVFADIKFIENKTVLGQLLIMDAFNRIANGKGILKTPVGSLNQQSLHRLSPIQTKDVG